MLLDMAPRFRLTVYFSDEELLKALEGWAKTENRSASNLAATILAKVVQDYEKTLELQEVAKNDNEQSFSDRKPTKKTKTPSPKDKEDK